MKERKKKLIRRKGNLGLRFFLLIHLHKNKVKISYLPKAMFHILIKHTFMHFNAFLQKDKIGLVNQGKINKNVLYVFVNDKCKQVY